MPQVSSTPNPKRILVLCSYGYTLPAYQKFNPAFLLVMETAGVRNDHIFFEHLDLLNIKDIEQRPALADMLRHKYADNDIDLVVTLHGSALSFLMDEAKDIFPNVPIMSWIVQETFDTEEKGHRIFRMRAGLDVPGTLERALELFPNTRHVIFISGVTEAERQVEQETKSAFANWESNLQFE